MKGTLDLKVTRVLEAGGLAFVAGVWFIHWDRARRQTYDADRAQRDVLRRQDDGSWRFVIDNPWGTD